MSDLQHRVVIDRVLIGLPQMLLPFRLQRANELWYSSNSA